MCGGVLNRAGDLLVAVGEVQQVLHVDKGVAQDLGRNDPLLRVDQQHLLQQAHELYAVRLLRHQVTTFQIHHHVHLGRHSGHFNGSP